MTARLYIRPVARIAPQSNTGARVATLGVGGRSDMLFAAVELIDREGSKVTRNMRPCDRLQAPPAGLPELLDRVARPRPAIAGVVLDDEPTFWALVERLLRTHSAETGSPVAAQLLEDPQGTRGRFTRVLPTEYARVREALAKAEAEGLDPGAPGVWEGILAVARG